MKKTPKKIGLAIVGAGRVGHLSAKLKRPVRLPIRAGDLAAG